MEMCDASLPAERVVVNSIYDLWFWVGGWGDGLEIKTVLAHS